jgi:hypothetical protein
LPSVWPTGSAKGLRLRGGFEIDSMAWDQGKLQFVSITSHKGGNLVLRYKGTSKTYPTNAGQKRTYDGSLNPVSPVPVAFPVQGMASEGFAIHPVLPGRLELLVKAPAESDVRCVLYTMGGTRIRSAGRIGSGLLELEQGSPLASGTYFAVLFQDGVIRASRTVYRE